MKTIELTRNLPKLRVLVQHAVRSLDNTNKTQGVEFPALHVPVSVIDKQTLKYVKSDLTKLMVSINESRESVGDAPVHGEIVDNDEGLILVFEYNSTAKMEALFDELVVYAHELPETPDTRPVLSTDMQAELSLITDKFTERLTNGLFTLEQLLDTNIFFIYQCDVDMRKYGSAEVEEFVVQLNDAMGQMASTAAVMHEILDSNYSMADILDQLEIIWIHYEQGGAVGYQFIEKGSANEICERTQVSEFVEVPKG